MSPLPVIPAGSLVLRPLETGDAPRLAALIGERAIADTTLHIPHPYDLSMAEEWIAAREGAWSRGENLNLAVALASDGSLMGGIGLALEGTLARGELGYWIASGSWGRGHATAAARAMIAHGFGVLGLHRIHARHLARNPASGRVLEKAGMTREGLQRGHVRKWDRFEDLVLWGILAGDARS